MSEPNIERIIEYLRAHAGSYGVAALRAQLLETGYSAGDVDTAIARFQSGASSVASTGATVALPEGPSGDAIDPDELRRALAYIEQNRSQYSAESLRGALVQSGYSAATVDAAMRQAGPIQPKATGRRLAWPFGFLIGLLNYGALSVFGWINSGASSIPALTPGLIILLLLAELVVGLRLRGGPRDRLGRALTLGPLFTILIGVGLFLLGLLLIGVCIAILGSPSFQ